MSDTLQPGLELLRGTKSQALASHFLSHALVVGQECCAAGRPPPIDQPAPLR
jgi:hypothetical protein